MTAPFREVGLKARGNVRTPASKLRPPIPIGNQSGRVGLYPREPREAAGREIIDFENRLNRHIIAASVICRIDC